MRFIIVAALLSLTGCGIRGIGADLEVGKVSRTDCSGTVGSPKLVYAEHRTHWFDVKCDG